MHDCHAVVCLVSGFTGSAGVLWNWKSSCHIPHVAHTLDVLRPSRETSDFSAWFTTVLPSVILSPYSDSQSLMLQSKSGSSACGKWITHNCINVDFCFFIFFSQTCMWYCLKHPSLSLVFSLVFATPLCCALFPQKRYQQPHHSPWRGEFILVCVVLYLTNESFKKIKNKNHV